MIPSTGGFLAQDFEIEEQPGLTYRMDLEEAPSAAMSMGGKLSGRPSSASSRQSGTSTSSIRGGTASRRWTCTGSP